MPAIRPYEERGPVAERVVLIGGWLVSVVLLGLVLVGCGATGSGGSGGDTPHAVQVQIGDRTVDCIEISSNWGNALSCDWSP